MWLVSPSQVEESRFKFYHGPQIPNDYLNLFQNDMTRLWQLMSANDKKVIKFSAMLFHLVILIDRSRCMVMLKQIVIRPCAERRGFFRIILYQIIRACLALFCDLYVESPFAATTAVLTKAFGDLLESFDEVIPHTGTDDVEHYIRIHFSKLNQVDLGARLNLLTPNADTDLIEYRNFPEIHCLAHRFPTALFMNYGPSPPCWASVPPSSNSDGCSSYKSHAIPHPVIDSSQVNDGQLISPMFSPHAPPYALSKLRTWNDHDLNLV